MRQVTVHDIHLDFYSFSAEPWQRASLLHSNGRTPIFVHMKHLQPIVNKVIDGNNERSLSYVSMSDGVDTLAFGSPR